MPKTLSSADLPYELPLIPGGVPTRESLLAEAAALGDTYTPASCHPADLLADTDEMLEAREDLAEFQARGYDVTSHHLTRLQLLRDLIAPALAEGDRKVVISQAQTQKAEESRVRLLEIRRRMARLGKAAGLPGSLFSLETTKTTRLNVVIMKVEEVLATVAEVRDRLPDKALVDALVVEARELLDEQKDLRTLARLGSMDQVLGTKTRYRLERLLLDTLIHLSAQGQAAFDGDASREVRYRLDHIYGRKASAAGDPGAGGTEGDAQASSPAGDDAQKTSTPPTKA